MTRFAVAAFASRQRPTKLLESKKELPTAYTELQRRQSALANPQQATACIRWQHRFTAWSDRTTRPSLYTLLSPSLPSGAILPLLIRSGLAAQLHPALIVSVVRMQSRINVRFQLSNQRLIFAPWSVSLEVDLLRLTFCDPNLSFALDPLVCAQQRQLICDGESGSDGKGNGQTLDVPPLVKSL